MTITGTPLTDTFAAEIGGVDIARQIDDATWTDIRAAFEEHALRRRVEDLVIVHDFAWSRDQVRPGFFTAEERAVYPPVRHPLVRTNPVNGRKSLFLGAHASHVDGWPIDEGRALLKELLAHVTEPRFCYRHEWTLGDLIVWDNRCVLHRATPYDATRFKRLMQRTTIGGDDY